MKWTDNVRIMEWKWGVVRKCLTGMGGISVQILAEIIWSKDIIWKICAPSAQYSAIYHTQMGHKYMDWTFVAYDIGQWLDKHFSLQKRPLIFSLIGFLRYSTPIYRVEIQFIIYNVDNLITKEPYGQYTLTTVLLPIPLYVSMSINNLRHFQMSPTFWTLQ